MNDADHDPEQQLHVSSHCSTRFYNSLLRAINEASPDGILVVDEQAVIVSYNQRFLDIWNIDPQHMQHDESEGGVPESPMLERALRQLTDPDAFMRQVEHLYRHPELDDHSEISLNDGRILERHSAGLFADDGQYLGRVWFFRDVTHQKQNEARLRDLAWHDPLTGVLNRRRLFERGGEEVLRAQRYRRPLALLMLDLDRFKRLNDQYGHAAGDAVLVAVCQRWRRTLRSVDILGRSGGEEFVILLPETGFEEALAAAERLRRAVSHESIGFEDDHIDSTVSIGLSMVHDDDGDIRDALRRADAALYQAKEGGRDRVTSHS